MVERSGGGKGRVGGGDGWLSEREDWLLTTGRSKTILECLKTEQGFDSEFTMSSVDTFS